MNRTSLLIAFAGLFLVAYIGKAEGLDCYECVHAELEGVKEKEIKDELDKIGVKFDGSCKAAKKPKKDYATSCLTEAAGTNLTCAKLTVDGKINGKKVKVAARGCFPVLQAANVTLDCKSRNRTEIISMMPLLNLTKIQQAIIGLGFESANTCFCKGDNCNSSEMIGSLNALFMISLGLISYAVSRL